MANVELGKLTRGLIIRSFWRGALLRLWLLIFMPFIIALGSLGQDWLPFALGVGVFTTFIALFLYTSRG